MSDPKDIEQVLDKATGLVLKVVGLLVAVSSAIAVAVATIIQHWSGP